MNKPCIDCGRVSAHTRCQRCAALKLQQIEARRPTSVERGYTWQYRQQRIAVLDRDGWICFSCGRKLDNNNATIDHIVPVSRDLSLSEDSHNMRAMCRSCNSSRGNRVTRSRIPVFPLVGFIYPTPRPTHTHAVETF
jgi:5-methylcytosine-specific restriction endonuclease McrA